MYRNPELDACRYADYGPESSTRHLAGKLMRSTWPGLYPLYYLDAENNVLCPDCANASEARYDRGDMQIPVAMGVNYEDAALYCDECSERIPSAYAEEED